MGKKLSPETRQKIADKVKFQSALRRYSEETKKKQSEHAYRRKPGVKYGWTHPNRFVRHPEGLEDDITWNTGTHYYNYGEYTDING